MQEGKFVHQMGNGIDRNCVDVKYKASLEVDRQSALLVGYYKNRNQHFSKPPFFNQLFIYPQLQKVIVENSDVGNQ